MTRLTTLLVCVTHLGVVKVLKNLPKPKPKVEKMSELDHFLGLLSEVIDEIMKMDYIKFYETRGRWRKINADEVC